MKKSAYNYFLVTHTKNYTSTKKSIFMLLYYLLFFCFNSACAAASLAIGTLNGEQET